MKLFNNILLVAIVAGMSLGFASCEKSDGNKPNNNTSDAIGTWYCHKMVFENGNTVDPEMTLNLNANGTGTASAVFIHNGDSHFKWSISDNTITITLTDEGDNSKPMVLSIVEMSSTSLVINGDFDIGHSAVGTAYFTRNNEGGSGNNDSTSHNESLLFGHWCSTSLFINGEDITRSTELCFFFYDNHTGLMSDNGETLNNDFRWNLNGNTLTVIEHNGETMNLTLTALTATTFSMTGSIVMDEQWFDCRGTWAKQQ